MGHRGREYDRPAGVLSQNALSGSGSAVRRDPHKGRSVEENRGVTGENRPRHRPLEPQVGIEPTTARLRIECSTAELLWRVLRYALERTRTAMPFGTTPSRWRVYQFHHQGNNYYCGLRINY